MTIILGDAHDSFAFYINVSDKENGPDALRFYCSRHMHGNFVMQKVIQMLPPNSLGFMIYELKAWVWSGSRSPNNWSLKTAGFHTWSICNILTYCWSLRPCWIPNVLKYTNVGSGRRMLWQRPCTSMRAVCFSGWSNAVVQPHLTWWTFCCNQVPWRSSLALAELPFCKPLHTASCLTTSFHIVS